MSGMASPSVRELIVEALVLGLPPEYKVYGYPRDPDMIAPAERPVCVWTDSLTRDATLTHVRFTVVVWVLTPRQANDAATESDLESSLLDVLDALHNASPAWTWTTATRGTLDDTWHGYRIDLTAIGKLETGD